MNVTLFHGTLGCTVALLSLTGAAFLLWRLEEWLTEYCRPNRPGRWVVFPDGRNGKILALVSDHRVAKPIAVVQPYDDHQRQQPAEWIPASDLRPLEYEEAA